ncbi:MAG: arginyltransferase [Myxococcales bacterium]|nr:arginyltransferase [Polyangiaceae bacterium]MDW8250521.1 arginyltransferase [Myxococcales bacterium]
MPKLLKHFIEPPRACVYLPEQTAQLENKVMLDVSPEQFGEMLLRGWRRFGPFYFRPSCKACQACLSLRIPVDKFEPSATQRRAWKRIEQLRIQIGPPQVTDERLALYHRWHRFREKLRGWPESKLEREEYQLEFAFPHPAAREITYHDDHAPGGSRLIGVGLCDETPVGWSAIYFFYDPEYARWSPGVLNILFQILQVRTRGLSHLYLGYWVEGCPSMRYKSTFRPYEILQGRPEAYETPLWQPALGVTPP